MKDTDLIFGIMASFGKKEYSVTQLYHLIKPFQVTEISLRTVLSRMKKNEIVTSRKEGKTAFYKFHTKGERIKLFGLKSFSTPDWSNWDQSWWGIAFSVPETNKENRYRIRKKLSRYHFALQYPGFWIRPFHKSDETIFNLKDPIINEHCKVFIYKEYFTGNYDNVGKLWRVKNIHHQFNKGLEKIKNVSKLSSGLTPDQALFHKLNIGDEIVKLLFKDPLLPPVFLPSDWKGKEIRNAFFALDQELTEISKPYWRKIFT